MEVTGSYDSLSVARDAQTIQLLQVVPATLMVYDCMLSLEDEVEYIWKTRFSSISVVYLTFQYIGTVYTLFSTAEIIANENTTNTLYVALFIARFPIMIFYAFCNHNYQFYPRFPWPRHMGQLFDLLVCPNHSSIAALRSLWWLEESSDHDSLRPGRGGRRHDCVRSTRHKLRRRDPTEPRVQNQRVP
ncbi:hypothetical protein PISMIDRAFT_542692 [Pisolithus microcarpus 441]|uniref:DUF6533 domain-containing protein n=1 Tax=Pisolithus microcarpus 441 TaxID=765257 RepID=A0A0C9ZFX2_9AGAM|nr:hypothetical protein PISMIDRAFT_542692 [Pisolithus microcarpus 441]